MIRMGRNSRSEQPDATDYQTTPSVPANTYQYGSESAQATSRVTTDSEAIARDIKEGRLSGFVGHGTTLTGDTSFQMMLRVDGHLTGTVSSDGGTLIVGTNGQVDANVLVAVATVNGAVNGDVVATEKIQLGRTAKVIGNISTPKLVIEEGAVFEGGCTMLKARANQEKEAENKYSSPQYSTSYTSTESKLEDDDDDDEVLTTADDDEEETAEVATV